MLKSNKRPFNPDFVEVLRLSSFREKVKDAHKAPDETNIQKCFGSARHRSSECATTLKLNTSLYQEILMQFTVWCNLI